MIDLSTLRMDGGFPKRLLLVEDDASVVESLRLFLKSDYEVYSAPTKEAGISLFRELHPSLVVLDLRLPDGDGLDVLREIRKIQASAPVIVLTGYASMNSVEESLRFGASDFMHKPFDGFTLKSRVDELISKQQTAAPAWERSLRLEDALQQVRALELKANAAAMFLHDAASPVTTALTASHFLIEEAAKTPDAFSLETREVMDMLFKSMEFIAGLFEQSRSIQALSRLEMSDVPLHEIAELMLELARVKAQERKVALGVRIQNPEITVRVNTSALTRVLLNIVHNAIEAVKRGSGRVNLLVDSVADYIEFSVIDNGPGIPEHLVNHIFEAHFTTKPQGSGLGLYISEHLVKAMGGIIAVRNMPGEGCCFSIKIPRKV